MKRGLVIRSTGHWHAVLAADGQLLQCRMRGKLRLSEIKSTNPVAVGDYVFFESTQQNEGVILEIEERKNHIIRKSTNLSKNHHIIASNIDQLALIVTLDVPETSTAFIDRNLITAEAYGIKALIIFNKIDLYPESTQGRMREIGEAYSKIGYKVHYVSALKQMGIKEVIGDFKDKKTLLGGHSGVGKSTLVNLIEPGLNLKTAPISLSHFKGKHTTTFSEMFPLKIGGFIIDAPGIKSFGIIDIDKDELYHYYPEIFALSKHCKFHNCRHINEPGCAVIEGIDKEKIALFRYENYLSLIEDENSKYR